jgi:AcrR family transcriptional regulator
MSDDVTSARRHQEQAREERILRAAIEELAESDYGGMSIEAVARRAGVNKTTVYRKWETKAELVRAALASASDQFRVASSLGELRADMRALGRQFRTFTQSPEGRSLMRLRLLQHPEPEIAAIAKHEHGRQQKQIENLISAAVERGEISRDVDMQLLLDMLGGALYVRIEMRNEWVSDEQLESIIEVLMAAARRPERRQKSAKKAVRARLKAGSTRRRVRPRTHQS